jgi:hypothetical protein
MTLRTAEQVRVFLTNQAAGKWPNEETIASLRQKIAGRRLTPHDKLAINEQLGFQPSKKDLDCARMIAAYILDCPILIFLMQLADRKSQDALQVAHGHPHAADVSHLTVQVLDKVSALIPGKVTEIDRLVGAVAGALHDTGRLEDIKRHARYSSIIADWYLKNLALALTGAPCPEWFRRRVVSDCAKHRSEEVLYKSEADKKRGNREIKSAHHAALLIADKLCGSEARVDEAKLALMHRLKTISPRKLKRRFALDDKWSLARICWNRPERETADPKLVKAAHAIVAQKNIPVAGILIDDHDHLNGGIYERRIEFFLDEEADPGAKFKGTMHCLLSVHESIAKQDLLTDLEWWDEALHTAAKAAKYLGFRFQLVFNGRTLVYSKNHKKLVSVDGMSV